MASLQEALLRAGEDSRHQDHRRELSAAIEDIVRAMGERASAHFSELAVRKSDFFRDLATTDYMQLAEEQSDSRGITFDVLCSLFDAAILVVENSTGQDAFDTPTAGGPGADAGDTRARR